MKFAAIILLGTTLGSLGTASAQDARMADEANATMVLLTLGQLCGEEISLPQWAYGERTFKRAWGARWKAKVAELAPTIQANFEAGSLKKQADTCDKIKQALAGLK